MAFTYDEWMENQGRRPTPFLGCGGVDDSLQLADQVEPWLRPALLAKEGPGQQQDDSESTRRQAHRQQRAARPGLAQALSTAEGCRTASPDTWSELL